MGIHMTNKLKMTALLCLLLHISHAGASPTTQPKLARTSDLTGQRITLADNPDIAATAIVFLGTQCPISGRYIPELNRINATLPHTGNKQIQLLGVISDPTVTRAAAVQFAQDFKIEFPILFDASGELAQQFSPRMTPQAFVLDRKGDIQYKGRIDDTFIDLRKQREAAQHHDLLDALTTVAAGQKPQSPETEAVGCYFEAWSNKSKSTAVTYTRDIAPILNSNCVQCHRDGQVAPFSLLTFDQAAHHAKQIARVTDEKLMPPWKALPGFGHFLDERRLTDREISLIAQWSKAGAPQGDPADLPPTPTFSDGGWTLGTPDIVLQMPKPFTVPASGRDVYRVFPIHIDIPKDEYVVGFEFKPGATTVLHHALFFLDDTGKARAMEAESKDGQPGYRSFGGVGFSPSGGLGGWAPGAMPFLLADGVGRPLRKGSDFVLQVHYHPDGKEHQDQSKLALYFAKKPIRQISISFPLITRQIDIPAGDSNYVRDVQIKVPTDVTLIGVTPHMHLVGKQMNVTAYPPDGSIVPLINIDDWDFRWQDQYRYAEPIHLPRGTVVKLHAVYDNSTANTENPSNPPQRVTFGEQTTNEMCICFMQMTIDNWILAPGEMPPSGRGAVLRHLFFNSPAPTTQASAH
jgi:peroxiredoxin/mono/diheme cytochrome c family protein